MRVLTLLGLLIAFVLPVGLEGQGTAGCAPAGNVRFVCGQTSPEDLVLVPGSQWVFASAYGGNGGVRLISVDDHTSTIAYPTTTSRDRLDARTYDTCPGPPDAEDKAKFTTHGLALRVGKNSMHTLYAVHHGKRESIEVFEVDARGKMPALTWVGCAVAPDPIGLNSVVPLPKGGFIGTDFLARGGDASARTKMMAGEPNGALWQWQTGKGWTKVPGSEAAGANGLEVSKDGKWLYVAAWGSQSFFRLSLGQNPPKRDTIPLGFRVDNIRWAPDGTIFASGQGATTSNVVKIDPSTLKVQEIIKQANTPEFGSGTVAVQIGKEIWVGSFRGDRIAIFPVMP
jgi:hypothetical protein